jgi:dephospho-CoA kinase
MIRAGLTGGMASGKSFVASELEKLGCHVVRADELGHQALLPGGESYEAVIAEFGPGILNDDRTINRRALGQIVFSDPAKLERLNSLVHPVVIRREEEFIARAARNDPSGISIVEAAILIETGGYRRFHRLILAVCTEEQQVERAMARDKATREEVLVRLRRQMPLEEKRKYADYVIDTSGPVELTVKQTRHVYESLRSIHI